MSDYNVKTKDNKLLITLSKINNSVRTEKKTLVAMVSFIEEENKDFVFKLKITLSDGKY